MVTRHSPILGSSMVDAFTSMIRGEVLIPGAQGHDAVRTIRNGMIDRPRGTRDIVDAVTFARERGSATSIRGGAGLNFPGFGEEKDALLRSTYGPNHDRLVSLKTHYDPDIAFHMNQNIRPAGR